MSDRRSTVQRKLLIVCGCLLSLVVCCGLAWWQWERFTSAGGSFQNLGYVLQWPLFGLFPAFMVWRMTRLRRQAAARDEATEPPVGSRERARTTSVPTPRRVAPTPAKPPVPDELMDEEDAALAEYNAYLAQLNAREQERN
ncbi:hypothetical protein [Saccharomonospora glauca]|uniref:Glucitol operon activator n=1 Tax=Saccharomonospora glauca K62 TaxID=928724 RepID=I1D3Y6_9PSEU|nr:hypothetical protein [Saccharomonospora glauca]EIE99660.1 glucitol operon activator [Saccharomonospora glauca K62]